MDNIIIDCNELLLSKEFFIKNGYTSQSASMLFKRRAIKLNNKEYVVYNSLSKETQSRIPTENLIRNELSIEDISNYYHQYLYNSYSVFGKKYVENYTKEYPNANIKYILEASCKRVVWECLLQCYEPYKYNHLKGVYTAFNLIFPNLYKDWRVFNVIINRAKKDIDTVCLNKTILCNPKNAQSIPKEIYALIANLYGNPKCKNAKQIHTEIEKICKKRLLVIPSYSFVRTKCREFKKNATLYKTRYGEKAFAQNAKPYTHMEYKAVNVQWQIDGWNVPFYTKGYYRPVLVVVRDTYSKKVVGYSLDDTESTLSIVKALEDAVKNTGCIPREIVSDNHSFNKTNEATNLKDTFKEYGCTWIVTHNPQYKAIAERYFQHLGEAHCANYDGYLGKGILSNKRRDVRPSPEELSKFQKSGNWLTNDDIKAICINVIHDFNHTPLAEINTTPSQLYTECEIQSGISISDMDRLSLFILSTKHTVERGQINIIRAGKKYEFQLNAEQLLNWNFETVLVRYEDLNECIYIYSKKDVPIGRVDRKPTISGAKYEQTDEDKQLLYQHAGRVKGYISQSKKQIDDLNKNIHEDTQVHLDASKMTKDMYNGIIQKGLQNRALDMDLDINNAEIGLASLRNTDTKVLENKSPIKVRNHQISVINEDLDDED